MARGLSVVQGDADPDLVDYPDDAFDFVILSQTLQATHSPRIVLEQLLRIGRKVVVSFPNFGNWRDPRRSSCCTGRMPVTENLPYTWYDTPNIHFCTIRDFVGALRRGRRQDRDRRSALSADGTRIRLNAPLVVLEPVRPAGGVPADALAAVS